MNKVGLIFVVVIQIMVLQAIALESEAPAPMLGLNPLEVKFKKEVQLSDQNSDKIADHSSLKEEEESKVEAAAAPDNVRRLGKHHSTNKSVTGGGVILGGLVTATFAAVFCYIRVTRKRDSDH